MVIQIVTTLPHKTLYVLVQPSWFFPTSAVPCENELHGNIGLHCRLRWDRGTSMGLSHKSHNAPVPCPTMQHFVTEMCTCVHISVTKCCIVACLFNASWDSWDGSSGVVVHQLYAWLIQQLHVSNDWNCATLLCITDVKQTMFNAG